MMGTLTAVAVNHAAVLAQISFRLTNLNLLLQIGDVEDLHGATTSNLLRRATSLHGLAPRTRHGRSHSEVRL